MCNSQPEIIFNYNNFTICNQLSVCIEFKQGMGCTEILEHYFTGATVETYHG